MLLGVEHGSRDPAFCKVHFRNGHFLKHVRLLGGRPRRRLLGRLDSWLRPGSFSELSLQSTHLVPEPQDLPFWRVRCWRHRRCSQRHLIRQSCVFHIECINLLSQSTIFLSCCHLNLVLLPDKDGGRNDYDSANDSRFHILCLSLSKTQLASKADQDFPAWPGKLKR